MAYIVRYQFKIRSLGRLTVQYVRSEYATNNASGATRFDTLEQAENEADIIKENMSGYAKDVKFFFIKEN